MNTMHRLLTALALSLLLVFSSTLLAGEAQPLIKDPEIASRMAALTAKLRCLVCQGQSVAESGSDFSNDIRREVKKLMEEGRSDQEVIDFLVQRYGDFILFEPPVKGLTAMLWFGPFVLLITGVTVLIVVLRRRARGPAPELTPEEIARAERLLAGDRNKGKSL